MVLGTSRLLQTSKTSPSRPKDILKSASSNSTLFPLFFSFFFLFLILISISHQQGSSSLDTARPARRGEATQRGGVPRGEGGDGLRVMSSSDLSPGNASTNHLDPICNAGSPASPAFPSQLRPPASLRPTAAVAQGPAPQQSPRPTSAPPFPRPTGACTPLSQARGDWEG